ncbi:MAG: hypothetical protein KC592_19650, partial [Nitrospira sp.]|nr:hypothetical protein [Nitrospira sp.]
VGTIFINDQKVAEGKIEHTQCCVFSADEGADVGLDEGTPVIENYGIPAPYRFNGTIKQVTVDLQDMTAADRHEANQARIEYTHKKALSD